MPLHRRLPKRGFTNIFRKEYRIVNVDRLAAFEAGSAVDPAAMLEAGLVRKGSKPVKVLGDGALTVALTVRAHKFTRSAIEKIEAAGGTAEVVGK
jgi:large subunit ribosomal protein L15